eukprot:CAMPEP_0172312138 /NCGR_PEP_ID=MMETSP1058-20130122/16783_1 /TAXON_ID=83371 /ORGANISM="Detonula confervacea, Strain CCMP 353" /LENGTH=50 /DNA_ID=CAMNT_0013025511 /DNA_START=74 /DNA_END=222 /DNA_ORIENTATION=-
MDILSKAIRRRTTRIRRRGRITLSLNAYLKYGPKAFNADNKNDNGGNASP